MTRPVAYDFVRLALAPFTPHPRGIDRIDLGWAQHLFENWDGECVGIAPMLWGMRWFPRGRVLHALSDINAHWQESGDVESDAAWSRFLRRMAGETVAPLERRPKWMATAEGAMVGARILTNDRWSLGGAMRDLPKDSLYVNVGHYGLGWPPFINWLDRRPDVKSVVMLHDVIPMESPELVAPSTAVSHHHVLDGTVRHASLIVVPSESSKRTAQAELDRRGSRPIPIEVVPLPINDVFSDAVTPTPLLRETPYFACCGAVEPRKNQLLLLQVWKDLVRRHGSATPRLVIAGSPGWASDQVLYFLDKCEMLKPYVMLVSGLSTPAMRNVMAHARAVLMPSFDEGFGLPPVEALTTGTPAILSDIPAHREAAGAYGQFIGPTDGPGWMAAIEAMMRDTPDYLALKTRIAGFRPLTWPDYMARINSILHSV